MNKKTPIEMERDRIIKITRNYVRFKKSLEADEELNDLLPDRLEEFDKSLQNGELKSIVADIDEVLDAFKTKD